VRLPYGWLLPTIALAATALAVWADSNFVLAIPAGVVAVTSAGFIFAEVWLRSSAPTVGARGTAGQGGLAQARTARTAFRSGRLGREDVVAYLDRLELAGPNPELPGRRVEDMRRLARMSVAEFREYVRSRLDDLEART
jgi:hypothetical protein